MRTAASLTAGAILAWCILAIWRGPTAWLFTRIPPATHPDCRTRIRVWHNRIERDGAPWPE